jgi:Bacterial regulatory proteins, lacI family
LTKIAAISDIARDAGVSVETVLRVLNREESNTGVVARIARVLESHGSPVPQHLRAALSDRVPDGGEGDAGTRLLPAVDENDRPVATVVGDVVERASPMAATDIGGGAQSSHDLVQAMLQAAEGGRSGLASSLRYQSLEIRPLAERITLVDQLLERLVEDFHAAKDELRRGRTERVEDLALLVDLITASWRTVEQRLNRLERKLDESLPANGARSPAAISQPDDDAG